MSVIFNALPGIEVPVDAISTRLADMWTDGAAVTGEGHLEADDAKATQLNVVLHLGLNTTPEDAKVQFGHLLSFSRNSPCRVVVLCPLEDPAESTEMQAKIYGECHLGKSKSDKRCVEFVILSYPISAREHLENQASICLSTDLPLYYWAHRFSASARLAAYRFLLSRAKRVIIDSAIVPEDALHYPWPRPEAVRDLAYARLLPLRQTLGQFLSRYEPATLSEGLETVTLRHAPDLAPEGRVLLVWLRRRLESCGQKSAAFNLEELSTTDNLSFALEFRYPDPKFFRWQASLETRHADFDANLGQGGTRINAPARLLDPVMALSEAMFY